MAGALPNGIRTSDLKSRVLDLAQTSVYQIKLVPPPGVVAFLNERGIDFDGFSPDVELLCNRVTLPVSRLNTFDVNNNYAGVNERMVNRRDHGTNMNFSFYVDRDYKVIDIFDGWQDFIVNQRSNTQYRSRVASYRMQYPNQYRGSVFVTKFEKEAYGAADQFELIAAFPLQFSINELSYNQSQILQCNVSIDFIRYVRTRIRLEPFSPEAFNFSVLDFASINTTTPGFLR